MREEEIPPERVHRCPTLCDPECDVPCHEIHYVPWLRDHQPEACPGKREWVP